jgi:hypothetical protein
MNLSDIFNNYMKYKKITIPVTALVCVCIVGGIIFAVSHNSKDTTMTADKEAEQTDTNDETYEYICYDTAGTYSDEVTYTAADIKVDGVVLENATFDTLTITEDVGEGSVTLNKDTVNETLVINGGGQNSVYLNGGTYAQVISNDEDVHIVIGEKTTVTELNVLSSSYVEVYGAVETANVLPTTYVGEVAWKTGFETKDGAVVTALNISEDVDTETFVADTSNGEVKSTAALSKTQTSKVQSNTTSVTSTVQSNTTNAQATQNNNSANTGTSSSNSNSSSGNSNVSSTQKPSGSNTGNSNTNISSSNTTVHEHNYTLTNTTTETITDVEAYDEEVPVYNTEKLYVCNKCGYTTYGSSDADDHAIFYAENSPEPDLSHTFMPYQPGMYKTGTKTVHHDAVTHKEDTYTYTCSCGDSYTEKSGWYYD